MTEADDFNASEEQGPPDLAQAGVSPYSTGGGGVTFERKVAVTYLARLLVGDGGTELGDERRVVTVAFQQAPDHAVDDLVVFAARADEAQPSLVLAVGVRRAPSIVESDEPTRKLIRDFLAAVIASPVEGLEHRFALVVAGPQDHARQLASLADLAAGQADARAFFKLVETPKKFTGEVRRRLTHVQGLVREALTDLKGADLDGALVQRRTWELLSRLAVLMPRLEAPDEMDWGTVVNALIPVARDADLSGASRLRDRLVALAGDYAPKAATIDLTVLRRDAHSTLDTTVRRHQHGWRALGHLHGRALSSVRHDIRDGDGIRSVRLDRHDVATPIIAAATSGSAVVAHGESGVGKSALVLAAAGESRSHPNDVQTVCINLRHLPRTTLEFETLLGVPIATLFGELSAPQRLLVIDGADAVAEGLTEQLKYVVDAARAAALGVIAITTTDSKQVVCDTVAEGFGATVVEHVVPPLTDEQVETVIATFGELSLLAQNPRSRELLRRPVVVDLLLRSGISGTPLSDIDAMQHVWRRLVRRDEQRDRGTPDARELAMLRLADLALFGGDPLDAIVAVDATALDGLRRDGLLHTPASDPFRIGPEFAHDEVRRYAVARRLLSGADPTTKLRDAGVPRWALGSARLACQAWLSAPDTHTNGISGRLARLQFAFDSLVDDGHGERWGDVPGEALLTLGDPGPPLRDAWSRLRADDGRGLRRLCRLVDQRLRDEARILRVPAVEPLIDLLLDDNAPWRSGDHVQHVMRGWLRAHVIAGTPAGHPLRARLRDRIVHESAAADKRLESKRAAAAAARAARSPEEIERDRLREERNNALFAAMSTPRRPHRHRPELPYEIRDATVVELLALLGPDIGDQGADQLRRIGRDAPSSLAPAVEEFLTGRALASYDPRFLAELTESYYIIVDEDGSGWREGGIRDHQSRSLGMMSPLSAWYRGPFMPLLQTDFVRGVAVVNRMLNRAALARARRLAGLDRGYGLPLEDGDLDRYQHSLQISGPHRIYVGDDHVWMWYRGTGVGPDPCRSALQALERVCDQMIDADVPLARIAEVLLAECQSLAMLGLLVGVLVRHLEKADKLIDTYLADPRFWHFEFSRAGGEMSGMAASSDGVFGAERRRWSLREASAYLVMRADDARAEELRGLGEKLVENARQLTDGADASAAEGTTELDDTALEEQLVTVRAWASGLDRSTYNAHEADGYLYIQSTPPSDVVEALRTQNEPVQRAHEFTRLMVRYGLDPKGRAADEVPAEELAADLALAVELFNADAKMSSVYRWDEPIAVAAAGLSAYLLHGVEIAEDLLQSAVKMVLAVCIETPPRPFEFEETFFEQGADRSAARVLGLLLLPSALPLLPLSDGGDDASAYEQVEAAGVSLARAVAYEVRLHLARGLDPVWQAPCAESGTCGHQAAFRIAIESMRDCVMGKWEEGRRSTIVLDEPVEVSLAQVANRDIYFPRLGAAIRACSSAVVTENCVSSRARAVLDVALAAQRCSLLAYEEDMDDRGTHALERARAYLTLAQVGELTGLYEEVAAGADSPRQLDHFLRALSAAAEETTERAATARRLWPSIATRVLDLNESGHAPFSGQFYGERALAALLPNAAHSVSYLYREVEGEPIAWWAPLELQHVVERWLPIAGGKSACADQLIRFLRVLPIDEQVGHGLVWVSALVAKAPDRVASRSYLLADWLVETRSAADSAGHRPTWQRVVDSLVVAGETRLAPYSE